MITSSSLLNRTDAGPFRRRPGHFRAAAWGQTRTMPTPEACLERAKEAERLAALVSYERDRTRLTRQAAEWRERAAELASRAAEPAPPPETGNAPGSRRSWWARLTGRRPSRGG